MISIASIVYKEQILDNVKWVIYIDWLKTQKVVLLLCICTLLYEEYVTVCDYR